jgi:hypothetical protein
MGFENADAVSVRRIDGKTIESTLKKNGRVVTVVTSKVSSDGKSRISTFMASDAAGNSLRDVLVYGKKDLACGPKFCEKQCKGKCGNGKSCDCPRK